MQELLAKTPIVEGDRIMSGDNFAHLYDHHLNIFIVHKRDSEPYWDIVQTATFVLDIADEEFRQEQKYDIKQSIELAQSKVPQKEITLNDLKPDSLDRFNEKRLGKKYSTDSGITLRTDFKGNFLNWIEINQHDFQEAGLGGNPLKIFNDLCVSAKADQALRLSQQ
ncbi:MAG: hypothetical protein ACKO3R_03395 [bacterium]